MLLLCLLLIQLAQSHGNLMCFNIKYAECLKLFIEGSDNDYCNAADQTIGCTNEKATECGVQDSALVHDMNQRLREVCHEGTELNDAYKKHKSCVFQISPSAVGLCYFSFIEELTKYRPTGNMDEDELQMFKITCRFNDRIDVCLSNAVLRKCGLEGLRFHHQFFDPSNKLVTTACMENQQPPAMEIQPAPTMENETSFIDNDIYIFDNGAAAVNLVWMIVLQASVLFALKFFKLTD